MGDYGGNCPAGVVLLIVAGTGRSFRAGVYTEWGEKAPEGSLMAAGGCLLAAASPWPEAAPLLAQAQARTGLGCPIVAVIVVGLVVLLWIVLTYNGLVTLRNRVMNALSQIDVQLKRRYDLIPNLVETVRRYLQHERETLEAVVAARARAVAAEEKLSTNLRDPQALRELIGAETALTGALGRLFAVVEAYPELKANETIRTLQEELTSTENRIAFARQAYNDMATQYNIRRERLPSRIVAGMFGFQEAPLFEVTVPEERVAPKVVLG
jgi:LemA protein